MYIPEIAITALTTLGLYLTKGVTAGVGKDIWELLKKTFHSDREKQLLDQIKKSPTDPIIQGKLVGKLEEKLEEDVTLMNQMKEILGGGLIAFIVKEELVDKQPNYCVMHHY